MPALQRYFETADTGALASELAAGRAVQVEIEGEKVELRPEEVEIETSPREGLVVQESGGFVVALDTRVTHELELEGLARDLVRHIQNLRKECGFHVADRIITRYAVPDEDGSAPLWDEVIKAHGDFIRQETLSLAIETMPASEGKLTNVGGHQLLLKLERQKR